MAKKPATGRASIFRGKDDGVRVQGILTKKGGEAFERSRKDLQRLAEQVTKRKVATISDADVIEYLALGEDATTVYLEKHAG